MTSGVESYTHKSFTVYDPSSFESIELESNGLTSDQIKRSPNSKTCEPMLFDRDTRLILESTCNMEKSANQIILDSNIAQSTAYRKLKKLVSLNFLNIRYVIGEYGRWETRYRSNLCLFDSKPLRDSIN